MKRRPEMPRCRPVCRRWAAWQQLMTFVPTTLPNAVFNSSNAESIRCLSGNLFDLDPEKIGQFDLVIACEIVEHVAHTVDLLLQLKRFVGPGGRILITTLNGGYFRNKLTAHSEIQDFTALDKQQFKPDSDGHLFLITPQEMESLAHASRLGSASVHWYCGPRRRLQATLAWRCSPLRPYVGDGTNWSVSLKVCHSASKGKGLLQLFGSFWLSFGCR